MESVILTFLNRGNVGGGLVPMVANRAAPQAAAAGSRPAPKIRRFRRRRSNPADAQDRSRSHLANRTAADRVLEYGTALFRCGGNDGELLICQCCDKAVDPRRRSSIEYHLKSIAHQRRAQQAGPDGQPEPRSESPALVLTVEEEEYVVNKQEPDIYDLTDSPSGSPASPSSPRPATGESGQDPAALRLAPLQLTAVTSLCEAQLASTPELQPDQEPDRQPQSPRSGPEDPQDRAEGRQQQGGAQQEKCNCCCCLRKRQPEGRTFPDELVLKVRRRGSADQDFVLVQLPLSELSLSRLTEVSCTELDLRPDQVSRLVRLPNTRLRTDRDVSRLLDFQELELVEHRGLTDR